MHESGYGGSVGTQAEKAVFEAVPDAVVIMDAEGLIRDWNPAAQAMFGYRREEAIGQEVAELIIPGALRDTHRNALRRYLETRESAILGRRLDVSALAPDGSEFPVELTVTRLGNDEPPTFAGFIRTKASDVVARRENVRLQHRMAFLAQAWLALDRSLDYRETLQRLADLTVPELAQLTVIDLLNDSGLLRAAVASSPDQTDAHALVDIRRDHPLELGGVHPVASVLRSGQPVLLPSMSPTFLRRIAQGDEHLALMQRLRYHSAIVVPLVARRHVLGTLSLLRLGDSQPFDEDDLVLAEELARRAALTVDNVRLFESVGNLAQTLQESLLPPAFPDIPGVRMTGRYRAAQQGQEVGGDFYDAFPIDDGRWGIAIGDVCGKGPQAAALTALARYTIRAYADRDAASVLRLLNEAVVRDRDILPERYLTAVFAILSPTGAGLDVELAAAGHPPPLVLRADGTVAPLEVSGPLIGISAGLNYGASRTQLRPGDTMVLYTDGLTDARAPARIVSDEDLVELLRRGRGLRAESLAAFMEEAVTRGEDPRDDIALLVIELPASPAN